MTRYSKPRYAAQVRSVAGLILTRPVTDTATPLFDDAMSAHDSVLIPPSEYPAITAEIWAGYIAAGQIEVWKIRTNSTGFRRAEYIPDADQPRTAVARAAAVDAFLDTESGRDFLRHVATVGGFTWRGLTLAEDMAVRTEAVEVLGGNHVCACGSDHILIRRAIEPS